MSDKAEIIDMTADIVSAFVSHNSVAQSDLAGLIHQVFDALTQIASGAAKAAEKQEPAISVRKSITPDYLICLEDGKKFKSLKRHLRTHYDLDPDEYRDKWNLPRDYPMVAPNYAQARSKLAKKMGLGQKGRPRRRGSK
ncbi:MAG: MucR family transcriptional regulator [Parvibaculum sp.]|jgi:predicted transcriptional regulator|uniref:MucR family transcriptional regulator n=1 Tax=Parvibaculum sp. TaxID=2024848 RepID=UPI000DCAF9DE|nr:MucR family transcriptional regulator [Parvibaculum sp.]MDR3497783.1 MucR family transcriptional regulator [Parvibaculum sp.]RAW04048.1 MucR family transcriptional regulator [Aerococcus urinae]